MRDALSIEDPLGSRWELALELLVGGGGRVRYRSIEIGRHVEGPRADSKVHVEVDAASAVIHDPRADQAVERGLANLASLEAASAPFAALLQRFGTVIEYVYDYGHGAVALGVIEEGRLRWLL